MDVSVVIGTFGATEWYDLAQERAAPSVPKGIPVIHRHGLSLATARNEGLGMVETEWVIHLDADDELEEGYVDHLAAADADLRVPSVRYIRHGRAAAAYVPNVAGHTHDCIADCLPQGNYCVIGTALRTELAIDVGAWREWPVYEDWDLFLRCHLAGASFETVKKAIYRAHVRDDSRNRGPSMETKNDTHRQIVAACGI